MQLYHALLLAAPALAAVHEVDVGESGLTFDPQVVSAQAGDIIVFSLYAQHDVVEGDFSSPCTPNSNGFFSGPYSGTDNGKKKFVVNVTTSDAIYYYCSVQRHCQSGMVGGINVPSSGDNSIQAYADAAQNVNQASAPNAMRNGQLLEEAQVSSLTASASGSATPTGSSASATASGASTTPAASGSGSATGSSAGSQSTGAADVVAVGQVNGLAAMALGVAAWFL